MCCVKDLLIVVKWQVLKAHLSATRPCHIKCICCLILLDDSIAIKHTDLDIVVADGAYVERWHCRMVGVTFC